MLQTELLKSSPNRYTVLIDGEEVGESWSASSSGRSVHGLKSRKRAIKNGLSRCTSAGASNLVP